MKLVERPLSAAALVLAMIAMSISACTWTEECSSRVPLNILLRADQMCPSALEAQARVDSELPRTGASVDSEARTEIAIPARVVCWYRSTEAEGITPCFWGTRASMLADATRVEPQPNDGPATWSRTYLLGCDCEGSLYGEIVLVADADPGTGLPATPVDCPEMVTPDSTAADKLTSVTTFVGSDDYPARINCEYDTTETAWCGFRELHH